jgi:GMP synthase (glutamine-hydrolysing)
VLLIDNGTTLLQKLEHLIPGEEVVRAWNSFNRRNAAQFDLVVLSGSSICQLKGNEDRYAEELAFIRETRKPLIGICFGCELIISAFGGALKELSAHSKGTISVEVLEDAGIFAGRRSFEVYENHAWIGDMLSPDLEVLARSEHGPEVLRHRSLPIYGLQFHPENHVEETFGDDVFLNILKSVTSDLLKT